MSRSTLTQAAEALAAHRGTAWHVVPASRDFDTGFLTGYRAAQAGPGVREGTHTFSWAGHDLPCEALECHYEYTPCEPATADHPGAPADVTVVGVYLRGVDILLLVSQAGLLETLETEIWSAHEDARMERRRAA